MTWQRTDLASSLEAQWPTEQALGLSKHVALCAICSRMCLCGHPCLCTRHCNSDQSWAFWTCGRAQYLCHPGKDTDYVTRYEKGDHFMHFRIFSLKHLYIWNHCSYELQTRHEHSFIILPHLLRILSHAHFLYRWGKRVCRSCSKLPFYVVKYIVK